jgi:hypothetical protein
MLSAAAANRHPRTTSSVTPPEDGMTKYFFFDNGLAVTTNPFDSNKITMPSKPHPHAPVPVCFSNRTQLRVFAYPARTSFLQLEKLA